MNELIKYSMHILYDLVDDLGLQAGLRCNYIHIRILFIGLLTVLC